MSAIYIVLPLALIFVIAALIVFVRAVRSGQFDDLDTPAVRLLHDDEEPTGDETPSRDGTGRSDPRGDQ